MNTLVTWIGFFDLEFQVNSRSNKSPIETILFHNRFQIEKVFIIFDQQNFKDGWYYQDIDSYVNELQHHFPYKKINLIEIDKINAADASVVYEQSLRILRKLKSEKKIEKDKLFYNINSGTHSMLISWLYISLFTEFEGILLQSYYSKKESKSLSEALNLPSTIDFKTHITQDKFKTNEKLFKSDKYLDLIGDDDKFREVVDMAISLSKYDSVNVLILGESGTGKEEFAKLIYKNSSRGQKNSMQSINVAAIPDTTIESQLFGFKKGAFTGADNDFNGTIMEANNNVLFLDEIGDLPLQSQPKLLRAIQEKKIRHLGDVKDKDVNVRFISATNCPEKLREDLYYRLAEAVIKIPPLRERKNDIPLLANHFLKKYNELFQNENPSYIIKVFHNELEEQLKQFYWKGNIRELQTVIKSSCIFSDKKEISINDINKYIFNHDNKTNEHKFNIPINDKTEILFKENLNGIDLNEEIKKFRLSIVESAIIYKGNQKKAAEFLNTSPQNLNNFLSKK
ncbi:MAG: sigma 54-interacting transcriptional regulator [Endomicrobiaceae bacterium]